MKYDQFNSDNEELKELLTQYNNFKNGKEFNFLEEDSFILLIDYFDEKDDVPQAIEAVDYAIEQFPFSGILLWKKADLIMTQRRYEEALLLLEKAEALDSKDVNVYILKMDIYLALDNSKKAASVLEVAIDKFYGPERIQLLLELSDVYDDYEEFDKVFDCLALVLEQDPSNEEALYKICFWTDFTGRFDESIKLHKELIDNLPYSHLAWFNLGTAYQGVKLYEKAIDAYLYAIAIDEKFDYAYRNLGDAYLKLRKYKDAIEALQKVLELSHPEEVIYEAIGHCFEKLKKTAQARFHYRKAAHLKDDDSHLYFKIAGTYIKEGQWESAIKNLHRALEINYKKADYHLALAECFQQLGKIKEAIMHYTYFIKTRPKNVKGWKNLISCLFENDFLEEALIQVQNAQQVSGGKYLFIYLKSSILFSLGKNKEALLQLQNALVVAPQLLKQFIEFDPSVLNNISVVEMISRFRKKK
ncbi:MAG: tetratricopeptide repeat protein [Bacteroidetes bacterium]|nr:tetratricopeptide repeat protein [Bacteroidota bacterium]